jgi:hypothetical protein
MNMANCATCVHKQNPDGGWCYMFRHEPESTCMKHEPIVASYAWNRALTDEEHAGLAREPFPMRRDLRAAWHKLAWRRLTAWLTR